MNGLLPQAHRLWHRAVIGGVDLPGSAPSLHDYLHWATHTHEQHRQALQLPSAVGENPPRDSIGVMVPDIYHDVEPQAAVQSNGLIHGAIQEHNERLEVGAFTPRP